MAQIAEIKIDKLENGLRLAAEFYTAHSLIGNIYYSGEEVIDFVQYGTSDELNEDKKGVPTLRLNEFDSVFLGKPTKYCNKLSEQVANGLLIKKGDIFICRTNGNPKLVGKAAIAQNNYNFVFASYLFRIRPKMNLINAETLVIFLNSKVGRSEIEKNLMVSNQSNFSPAKFREIKIPKYSKESQERIQKLVTTASAEHEQSKLLYQQAEQLLLQELELEDFTPEWVAGYETNYDNVLDVARIDAEYFQPKYEIIEEKIKKYKNGWDYLPKLIEVSKDKIQIEAEKEYKYVELADINASIGIVDSTSKIFGADLPSRAQMKLQKNDVVVSSVAGSIDKVGLILSEDKNLVGSTGFHIFKSKAFSPEVNLILCKNPVLQNLFIREASGTILTAIPNDSLDNIAIPKLDKSVQEKITALVQKSHKHILESRKLLEQAKREVEDMIESPK